MNPGELDKKIIIQKKVTADNGFGGTIETWVDVCNPWASIEPLQGRELFSAQQVNSKLTTKIKIRYRAGITSDMRALFVTRIFSIASPPINTKERNEELILMCEENSTEQVNQ